MPRSDARRRSARAIVVVFAALGIAACDGGDEPGRNDAPDVRGVPFRSPPAAVVEAPAPEASIAPIEVVAPAAPVVETPVPDTAPPEPASAAESKSEDASKYRDLTWDEISKYVYVPPSPPSSDPLEALRKPHPDGEDIPEKIRALSGTRVAIEGYVVPLDFKDGKVSRFIVLRSPLACCFAEAPPMNQWITATNRSDSEIDYRKYEIVRVSGEFDVGEETRDGYVVGIYRLVAEKVERLE